MRFGEEESGIPQYQAPTLFIGKVVAPFNVIWIAIPLIFVGLKRAGMHIHLLGADENDRIIESMSYFWPAIKSQYLFMSKIDRVYDANNYPLFFLLLVVLSIFLIIRIILKYIKQRRTIKTPGRKEVLIIVLFIPMIFFGLVLDTAKHNPRPYWDFYVDLYGFYYFRQEAIFIIVFLGISLLILLGLKLLEEIFIKVTGSTKRQNRQM